MLIKVSNINILFYFLFPFKFLGMGWLVFILFTFDISLDLYGEPLSSLAYGMAPLLFHSLSPIKLVNIWLPGEKK